MVRLTEEERFQLSNTICDLSTTTALECMVPVTALRIDGVTNRSKLKHTGSLD